MNTKYDRGNCGRSRDQHPVCVLLFLHDAASVYLPNICAFFSSCEWSSSSLKSQTATPNILLLSMKMVFNMRASALLANYSVSHGLSCEYSIKLLFDFLL